ncbi:hypothetical protein QWJ20_00340 [Pectobacterium sp. S5]
MKKVRLFFNNKRMKMKNNRLTGKCDGVSGDRAMENQRVGWKRLIDKKYR